MRYFLTLILTVASFSVESVTAGELREQYIKQYPEGDTDINERGLSPGSRPFAMKPRPTGVTEIGFERGGCFGTCPQYTVKITSTGRVNYFGERYVALLGAHTGRIAADRFQSLAEFVHDAGVASFRDAYKDLSITDCETTYTFFVIDGTPKLISNYANTGPAALWAIEQLIDQLVKETQWDHPPKNLKSK